MGTMNKKLRLTWASGIAIAYAAFAAATLVFVGFALGRPVDLVSIDYYAQSLREDERITAERNARDAQASIVQTRERAVTFTVPPPRGRAV